MTDEVKQEELVESHVDDDAGLEAGFAEARGDEPPTPEPVADEPTAESETPSTDEPAAEPEVPQPVFAGLTEDQLRAQLAKAGEVDDLKAQVRQLFGRFGEVNAKLQQSHQPMKITPDAFAKLRENYGDLADALAEDLSKLPLGGGSQPNVDLAPIQEQFQQELAKIKQESEMKLLAMRHRDWQTIRTSPDFSLWEQTQLPAEERTRLNESWDALEIADYFDKFKDWRSKSQQQKQQKQSRLEAAVTPTRGAPANVTAINDDDALVSGWKSVRR